MGKGAVFKAFTLHNPYKVRYLDRQFQGGFLNDFKGEFNEEGDAMQTMFWRRLRLVIPMVFVFVMGVRLVDCKADKPVVLGLEELIQMAIESSSRLKEVEKDLIAAESDLGQAKAGQWAQLDVIGTAGPVEDADRPYVQISPRISPEGFLTGRLRDQDDDDIGIFGRLDFALVQPLFTFGKISNRKKAAVHGVQAQKAARENTRGEVILNVKQLYYGLIVAQQGKGAAEDAEGFVRDAKHRIQRLLELKSTNVEETDLYRIEALESQIKQFRAKAESGWQVAYMALKKAIGLPDHQEFQLDRRELPKDSNGLREIQETYIQQAMERRPDLEQLEEGIAAKQALYLAARADLFPTFYVAAIGSLAGAPGRERLDISYFPDEFNHAYAGVVLGSHWHFDFGIGTNKMKKAKAEYERLLHTKEHAEKNIPVQVTKFYQDAVEARESYEAYEKGSVAARKWVVSAFANFDFGIGTARDLFDAIDRYGKNQGEYLLALFNYNIALANLSNAVAEYRAGDR